MSWFRSRVVLKVTSISNLQTKMSTYLLIHSFILNTPIIVLFLVACYYVFDNDYFTQHSGELILTTLQFVVTKKLSWRNTVSLWCLLYRNAQKQAEDKDWNNFFVISCNIVLPDISHNPQTLKHRLLPNNLFWSPTILLVSDCHFKYMWCSCKAWFSLATQA